MSADVESVKRCGFTVVDQFDVEQPCDRPVTGWRWYQGHEHEDVLDAACSWHENEGGRRLHDAEAKVRRVQRVIDELTAIDESAAYVSDAGLVAAHRVVAKLQAAIAEVDQ